jgi:CRP-like cAMP-binding protein
MHAVVKIVYESSERMERLYFPTTYIVSLLYTMTDGATAEMGLVGNDGVVGVALFMGGNTVPNRAVAQVAGDAFSVPAPVLLDEFRRGGSCQLLPLRYTQALITQISQSAVCNRLHSVEQRLCRWLLLTHDRAQSAELPLTQEIIANMLGGRRESVAKAAGRLQKAGLIRYVRGHITILDRQGLEAASCECYQVVGHERPLPDLLRRYANSLLAQISQTAACNRFHAVEARLARWLLMTHDRIRSNEFRLTQELLSHMLGVRREGGANAARALQRRNLISYVRGRITILNRAVLEAGSCGCYEIVKLDVLAKS